jgi:predicted PurR-regulated permease PerM
VILDDRPYTFDRVFRLLSTLALLALGLWLLTYLSDVLIPFAVAFLLAYLLNPLVLLIQRKVRNRLAAVSLALAGALLVVGIALAILIPLVKGEMSRMATTLANIVKESQVGEQFREYLPERLWEDIKGYATREEMVGLLKRADFWALAEKAARKVLPGAWGLFSGLASLALGLVGLLVVGMYLVFMLIDYQRVRDEWENLIPRQYRESVLDFLKEFDRAMSRHFRAQAVVAAIVGVLYAVGFSAIGLPMGILLGLFIGLLNMAPYLQVVGLIPAAFLSVLKAVETGGSVWVSLGLMALVFVIIQIIQDAILTPKIMGDVTGLSPAMILLSISVWGKLLGFLGLVLALPMTCLCLAYYRKMMRKFDANQAPSSGEASASP